MENVMSNIVNGKFKLVIKTLANKKKEILLNEGDYFLYGQNPIIKHDTLIKISEEEGYRIDKVVLEYGIFNSSNNFCFVHRAYGKDATGQFIDEVGEANPSNLDKDVSLQYPAIMSNKRAQDRLLIRMLGLQGQACSQDEIHGQNGNDITPITEKKGRNTKNKLRNAINNIDENKKTNIIKEEKDIQEIVKEEKDIQEIGDKTSSINLNNFEDYKSKCSIEEFKTLNIIDDLTIEEANNIIVDFGKFRKEKPTMKQLKEEKPVDFKWLLKTYKVDVKSSEKMKKFKKAAIMVS